MVPQEKIISNSNIEIPDVMSDEEIFLGFVIKNFGLLTLLTYFPRYRAPYNKNEF